MKCVICSGAFSFKMRGQSLLLGASEMGSESFKALSWHWLLCRARVTVPGARG